ncbi:hypothetical protein CONLIGDRAFT_200632 [Coniochaeta ligniaria NRRL 30616]|uniref:Uncharacterized protein n=1 Tax=Coniochaeta ligniaria NRRL 30616 TaxID=1408157 RepID=A0A1J7K188_9PEZI|nr:hypothetical protein CONLIGDRAFT_200632 [Coniochaeta ligniaria NRRL 30616]
MRNMLVPRVVPTILGAVAVLATTAILVIHGVLAHSLLEWNTSVRIAAVLSSVLEALVLVLLGWLIASDLRPWVSRSSWTVFNNIWFGTSLLLCTVAAAASIAAVVRLSNSSPTTLPSRILGSTATGFLVGSSVALGLSFALQLIFLVVHYIASRTDAHGRANSPESGTESRRSPLPQVKSIPYHQTTPVATRNKEAISMDLRSPPGSSGGRSATETTSSFRSSMSHIVRPISSKTRLLSSSQRSSRRPSSLDSNAFHERSSVATEDGFDSWDTSGVDPQNRQTVLESSSPIPGRFLETIPGSPTTSRSPSPGTPLDLEPPRTQRRSRSYSSIGSVHSVHGQRPTLTEHQSVSESHIHPLFRSDSPTPPPAATPGTVVTAAPNAGQVISDRQSIRTLNRMRSGSLPTAPSPLSRQGSLDDFRLGRAERGSSVSPSVSPELREEPEEEEEKGTERKMTPPIPDWILSAGSRLSMAGYKSRKLRSTDGGDVEG